MKPVSLLLNSDLRKEPTEYIQKYFSENISSLSQNFHKSIPGYKPSPLISLKGLSGKLGVSKIFVKDESQRFDLKAFKVLGASFAFAKYLKEKAGPEDHKLNFDLFRDPETKKLLNEITLVTASDGNHGRGLAWTAKQAECRCVVYMPRETSKARIDAIKNLDAEVVVCEGNHNYAVEKAAEAAKENTWLLVQDSASENYQTIPLYIMQGYLTLTKEIFDELKDVKPTHVFVQCGVGSLPAAVLARLVSKFGKDKPVFINVEPDNAACLYYSKQFNDGNMHEVTGELKTIMAGLACGMPSTIAWKILNDYCDAFVTCNDEISKRGMKLLANPVDGDQKIVSGESGAVTLGLLNEILSSKDYSETKEKLKLHSDSKILLISTEGDTDPEMYRKIVGR